LFRANLSKKNPTEVGYMKNKKETSWTTNNIQIMTGRKKALLKFV